MDFTISQQKAIDLRGNDVLVSAGAGSGKTTVLSTRLIGQIEKGDSITDFLVVTFTNAATADLRAKLAKRLDELCADNPEEKRYLRQLYALPTADIGTIDSFCLQYVKQYAAVLGLGGTSVGDSALCGAILADCAEAVLTDLCEREASYIDLLLDNFATHKSDEGLIKSALAIYRKMRAYPFYREWLDTVLANFEKEAAEFSIDGFFELPHGALVKESIEDALSLAAKRAALLTDLAEDDKQYAFGETVLALIEELPDTLAAGYGAFSAAVKAKPALRRPNGCSDEYVKLYKEVMVRRKKLEDFVRTEEELKREYEMSLEVLRGVRFFLLELDTAYAAEKKRRGIIDFADGEQYFLQLLVTKTDKGLLKTPLCRELSQAYKEVYIDEYQDVSPLQDAIFRLIGEGKRFMVGDVKQSIYGFRNAYPELFVSYCNAFSETEGGNGQKVLLKENFRCDDSIIKFCNHVFGKVYTKESAGSDYSTEALVHGKKDKESLAVSIKLYENTPKDSNIEVQNTVREIVRLINEEGKSPRDIAILSRKGKYLSAYANALNAYGVPLCLTVGNDVLLKQPEVLLATSALRVIDNPTDDISLAALLRSPLFRFTAAELYDIRRGGTSLFDDLRHTALGKRERNKAYRLRRASLSRKKLLERPVLNKGGKDGLSEKCAAFLEKLELYRSKALFLPVDKLLWFVYEDTGIMAYAPAGREEQYRANLLAFYRLAMGVESNSYKGVSVFTEHLARLSDAQSSPDAEKQAEGEGVRLMTVHGSKGLEFPVVFVVGCGGNIRKYDHRSSVNVDYKSGISFKLKRQRDAFVLNPLLRKADQRAEAKRAVAEELRILYVAFTRAEERLYISAAFKKDIVGRIDGEKQEAIADLFLPAVANGKEMYYNVEVLDGSATEDEDIESIKTDTKEWAELTINGIHPMPAAGHMAAAKLSASVLERGEGGVLVPRAEGLLTDREPSFGDNTAPTGARRGTANHLFMQFADFLAAEADAEKEADRLLDLGFVSAEERSLMDTAALGRFFTTPLYGEIKASPKVYREKRFTTRVDGGIVGAEGEDVLLQGVIDCFYLNAEGGYTLVDYKTDRARLGQERALVEKHGVQLGLYRLYIEKVTGRPVTKAYIYSFALDKAIDCGDPAKL